jgi:predicted small lipoprotein YifL
LGRQSILTKLKKIFGGFDWIPYLYTNTYTMKKLFTAITFLVTTLSMVSCSKDSPLYLGKSDYSYTVTGSSGSYNVTIEGAPKGTAQYSNVGSGWKYTWTQSGTRFLYVSAQNNKNSGSVTVSILKNGKIIATQTSSGAYVIASVDGTY